MSLLHQVDYGLDLGWERAFQLRPLSFGRFIHVWLLSLRTSPLVFVLLRSWGQVLIAVLADIKEMPRSALPTVHLEAQEDSLVSVLLSRGTFVFKGNGEPFKIFLVSVFTYPSMLSRTFAPFEKFLTTAAYEDSVVFLSVAPLLFTRLLGRMFLTILSSDR